MIVWFCLKLHPQKHHTQYTKTLNRRTSKVTHDCYLMDKFVAIVALSVAATLEGAPRLGEE
jgi:hypothetical protein